MFTRRHFTLAAATLLGCTVLSTGAMAQGTYPAESLRIIVPFGAGGGTDAVARLMAAGLTERLGIPVNVENRPGAAGVVGSRSVAEAATDGSVIGLLTSSLDSYKAMGRGDLTYANFTPLALVNFDPAGVQVRADSPFQSLDQALAAITDAPQDYVASASGIGGPWHIAWVNLLRAAGLPADATIFIPSEGAGPSLNELLAGAVDFVPSSVAEAGALIESGDVRPLAVMSGSRLEAFPDVPTVEEVTGYSVVSGVWRGFAGPLAMDPTAVQMLETEMQAVYDSADFQDQMARIGYGTQWAAGADFVSFLQNAYDSTSAVLVDAGLAQN